MYRLAVVFGMKWRLTISAKCLCSEAVAVKEAPRSSQRKEGFGFLDCERVKR